MHAFLITGGDSKTRQAALDVLLAQNHVQVHNRVTLYLPQDAQTFGIADVRVWQGQLALSPQGKGPVAGVIPEAHRLTQEAQQALLKTLEEPPGSAIIILETAVPYALLPTILSRVQIVSEASSATLEYAQTAAALTKVQRGSVGEILRLADTLSPTRDAAAVFLEEATYVLQRLLVSQKGQNAHLTRTDAAGLLRAALAARKQLAVNVSPKLVLDGFLLTIKAGQA